jgi:hypothetical protein
MWASTTTLSAAPTNQLCDANLLFSSPRRLAVRVEPDPIELPTNLPSLPLSAIRQRGGEPGPCPYFPILGDPSTLEPPSRSLLELRSAPNEVNACLALVMQRMSRSCRLLVGTFLRSTCFGVNTQIYLRQPRLGSLLRIIDKAIKAQRENSKLWIFGAFVCCWR